MSQKILMVPELQWRAGELSLRQCARCGRHRAHVRLVPQVGRVPLGGPAELLERGERIWLAVLEYCSWSGQTRSEPDRQYPHVPAILGRGDHRAVYRVSAPVDLIPEALERLMWPRRAAGGGCTTRGRLRLAGSTDGRGRARAAARPAV